MSNKKFSYLILFIFSLFFAGSCHTARRATEKTAQTESENANASKSETFRAVMQQSPTFRTMEAKAVFTADAMGQSLSVKGTIRIQSDSCISISLQPIIGIEVVRIHASREKITVIDRINSVYYQVSYNELTKETGLFFDYKTLQNLLCNQLFLSNIRNEELHAGMFDESEFPNGFELKSKNSLAQCPYLFDFTIDKNYQISRTVVMQRNKPETLTCSYSTFLLSGGLTFPNNIELTAFDGRRNSKLGISISKIEFNKNLNMQLSIPAKYAKGDISKLKF